MNDASTRWTTAVLSLLKGTILRRLGPSVVDSHKSQLKLEGAEAMALWSTILRVHRRFVVNRVSPLVAQSGLGLAWDWDSDWNYLTPRL